MSENESVSVSEMKEIERFADSSGISYLQMMENAGTAAFEAMCAKYPDAHRIVIFAGKGNNGGDGFVDARLYFQRGADVTVVLCEGLPQTEDAGINFERLKNLKGGVKIMTLGEYEAYAVSPTFRDADLVIDALYGTGFHGSLRDSGKRACELMNHSRAAVCSLDLPSGMNADTGEIAEGTVAADLTVAFHRKKQGHDTPAAFIQCGELLVVSIGIDKVLNR